MSLTLPRPYFDPYALRSSGKRLLSDPGCLSQFVRMLSLLGETDQSQAKGYPDLTTRSFLHHVHVTNTSLPILALVDYDPDGINILRCYRQGSDRLRHETDAYTPEIRWLGIKSCHLIDCHGTSRDQPLEGDHNSQATVYSGTNTTSLSSASCREPIAYLTHRDRTVALGALRKLQLSPSDDVETAEMSRELQVLLMLGVKTEIEWLDESGILCEWLDEKLSELL
ncbi:hypothetical protein G7046_g7053 [Stylonectria norvegica]|nr:hypothetical protein G7046_g7053 [Stylonectria norvegica]